MGIVRVAQAQINPTVGDFKGNIKTIVEWIERAKAEDADLVTFPELALCGYPPEDLLFKPAFVRDNRRALERVATHCTGIVVLVGFADSDRGDVFNAAALLYDGEIVAVYRKIELPNYGVFDEKRHFRPGTECLIAEISGARFSVTICEDIWIAGAVPEVCAARNGVHGVLNISGSPYHVGKLEKVRLGIVGRFAAATSATVFYTNMVGGQDELVFDGGSLVVSPGGELIACAARFEEDLLITDFEVPSTRPDVEGWNLSGGIPVISPRRPQPQAASPGRICPAPTLVEEVYRALVLGTRDYVRKNSFSKVVIGLSGGIDSALTAAIAVDGLGSDQVIGVTMPSQYTSDATLSDAGIVALNLGIKLITAPVEEIFQAYVMTLAEPFGDGPPGIELENLQARIRGNILMALSNRFGWLVLTTGNKSETAVGYCTLYGDMAGGFAVIKDVPKTLVYDLSLYVNGKAGREVIPRSIIDRAPSAELRPDQKDEDSLPPYAVLDPILKAYVEEDCDPCAIPGCDPAVVRDVVRMVDRNEYKRRQAPPGVKITPKAFGRDRRLPITNRFLDSQLQDEES